jgi:PadR family transcriptional regulator, regulatory protein AphA
VSSSAPPSDLNPVSYVVLGLISRDGPSTAYDLKTAVGRGVAAFWPFPHSQIYSETERLARLGLLAEEREHTGRRRRTYRITRSGQAALSAWLARPAAEEPSFRSLGILQLFFGQFAAPGDIAALASAQVALQEEILAVTAGIRERLLARGDRPWQLAVVEILSAGYRAMAQEWKRIELRTAKTASRQPATRARARRQPRAAR